jgi:hypothetical protein
MAASPSISTTRLRQGSSRTLCSVRRRGRQRAGLATGAKAGTARLECRHGADAFQLDRRLRLERDRGDGGRPPCLPRGTSRQSSRRRRTRRSRRRLGRDDGFEAAMEDGLHLPDACLPAACLAHRQCREAGDVGHEHGTAQARREVGDQRTQRHDATPCEGETKG